MKTFADFPEALAYFRKVGGAMNVHQYNGNTWEVEEYPEELAERISCTPREATAQALRVGGMEWDDIAKELDGWNE